MYGIRTFLSTFSRVRVFIWKIGSGSGSGSASRQNVGSGSALNESQNPDPHLGDKSNPDLHQSDADPQRCYVGCFLGQALRVANQGAGIL
jgi:hypothetical protein